MLPSPCSSRATSADDVDDSIGRQAQGDRSIASGQPANLGRHLIGIGWPMQLRERGGEAGVDAEGQHVQSPLPA